MPKAIVSVDVQDAAKWEKGFRTRGDLFKRQTVKVIHYTTEGNHVVCCFEVDDMDTYMKLLRTDETAEAMKADGLKRETLKVWALDRELKP